MKRFLMLLAVFLMTATCIQANENPIEVGAVNWGRDLDKALKTSEESGRPVFVLFQEVPGCSGCQNFGRTVLTHPLIVEAVEDEFLPVLVYNNRGGQDRELLDRFGEPAWNFQVVRFLDAEGRDIIPRKDRIWTISGIAARMVEALKAVNRPVPKYLRTLAEESDFRPSRRPKPSASGLAIDQVPGLTALQRARVESLRSVDKAKALEWLSPRQRRAFSNAEQKAAAGGNQPRR